jgi:hypothetical protein
MNAATTLTRNVAHGQPPGGVVSPMPTRARAHAPMAPPTKIASSSRRSCPTVRHHSPLRRPHQFTGVSTAHPSAGLASRPGPGGPASPSRFMTSFGARDEIGRGDRAPGLEVEIVDALCKKDPAICLSISVPISGLRSRIVGEGRPQHVAGSAAPHPATPHGATVVSGVVATSGTAPYPHRRPGREH